jgi:hypothetical protein
VWLGFLAVGSDGDDEASCDRLQLLVLLCDVQRVLWLNGWVRASASETIERKSIQTAISFGFLPVEFLGRSRELGCDRVLDSEGDFRKVALMQGHKVEGHQDFCSG